MEQGLALASRRFLEGAGDRAPRISSPGKWTSGSGQIGVGFFVQSGRLERTRDHSPPVGRLLHPLEVRADRLPGGPSHSIRQTGRYVLVGELVHDGGVEPR